MSRAIAILAIATVGALGTLAYGLDVVSQKTKET